jgi:hypothetical protein
MGGRPLHLEVNWAENLVSRPTLYGAAGRQVIGRVTVIGIYILPEGIVEVAKRLPTTATQQTPGRKPSPPPVPLTAKEAAFLKPTDWAAHIPVRFPEKPEEETRAEYFDRVWKRMRRELKGRAWSRVYFERRCYELKVIELRQPRAKP